jgi:hypothetical protein
LWVDWQHEPAIFVDFIDFGTRALFVFNPLDAASRLPPERTPHSRSNTAVRDDDFFRREPRVGRQREPRHWRRPD